MSDVVNAAVAALNDRMASSDFTGTAKFDIEGEGCIMVDGQGARAGDEDAGVTLRADADTFQQILSGDMNPTTAVMTGKLTIDGDMGLAMALGSALS